MTSAGNFRRFFLCGLLELIRTISKKRKKII